MRIHVVHHYELDEDTAERLCRIEKMLSELMDNSVTEILMPLLDELLNKAKANLAAVKANSDLDDSIIAVVTANAQTIKDLKAALDAAGTDPAKLQELSDTMDQIAAKVQEDTDKTSAAVTANTEVENPPVDETQG